MNREARCSGEDSDHELSGGEELSTEQTSLSLEERERKWGFQLEELKAATKVVQRLFHDPSLFVGDPYLEESRLYTMITRDRTKKRQFAEVYKTILKQEKSRRKRYLRREDEEAIRNTRMKREREQALNSLLSDRPRTPPLLICDNETAKENQSEAVPQGETGNPEDSLSDATKQILRLVGGFEALLRLHRVYSGAPLELGDGVIRRHTPQDSETSPAAGQNSTKERENTGGNEGYHSPLDYTVVTSLIAHFYRYLPHPYGTTMPPPIFPNTEPSSSSSTPDGQGTVDEWLVRLARMVSDQPLCGDESAREKHAKLEEEERSTTLGDLLRVGEDFVVGEVLPDGYTCHEEKLRKVIHSIASDKQGEEASPFLCHSVSSTAVVFTSELVRSAEVVLLEKGEDERFSPLSLVSPSLTQKDIARQALILYIARRLYGRREVMEAGVSPLDLDYAPPISSSEEPEEYCVFDDIRLYADDHNDSASLVLSKFRACNVCRVRYNHLHPYYYSLCHLCGEYNYNKRLMARDLRGKVVLLTGCRIKIGYAMAISLLRCGATLLGTTRFAHEAIARFNQEPDYESWKDRLHLFSLDMRDLWMVTQFCGFVRAKFPKLFAIINNAAQTIRRTPQYTEHLRQIEADPPPLLRESLGRDDSASTWHSFFRNHSGVTVGEPLTIESATHHPPFLPVKEGKEEQLVVTATTDASPLTHFDRYDTLAEESDTRKTNSWVMNLAEVEGGEAAEVMSINAIAPFIINSKLKPCLTNRMGDEIEREMRFIINVSAMEGMFYRYKQTTHPHTNMAKAALNMMTRTSGEDYARDGIFMNSVDTGWITDESPKEKKERRSEQQMLCPLDEVDAAARCLDLIYTNSTAFGKFYKDFKEICW